MIQNPIPLPEAPEGNPEGAPVFYDQTFQTMPAEQARAELEALQADENWREQYVQGNPEAVKRMRDLAQAAHREDALGYVEQDHTVHRSPEVIEAERHIAILFNDEKFMSVYQDPSKYGHKLALERITELFEQANPS